MRLRKLLKLFDVHFYMDDIVDYDVWQNGSGLSFHLGKLVLHLCFPYFHFGTNQPQGQSRSHPSTERDRDPTGS